VSTLNDTQCVAGTDSTRLQHAVVPAGSACLLDTARHGRLLKPVIQPKAWLPRHRDLKTGFTYLDDVTDTYVGLVEPRRNEVLAKTTCLQSLGALWKFFLPRGVVFLRVLQDDLFCATVQVGRTVFVIGDSLFRYKCGSGTDGLRICRAWRLSRLALLAKLFVVSLQSQLWSWPNFSINSL
jgi:hypothetical protein